MRVGGDRQDSTRSTRETATFGVLSSSSGDDEASPLFPPDHSSPQSPIVPPIYLRPPSSDCCPYVCAFYSGAAIIEGRAHFYLTSYRSQSSCVNTPRRQKETSTKYFNPCHGPIHIDKYHVPLSSSFVLVFCWVKYQKISGAARCVCITRQQPVLR